MMRLSKPPVLFGLLLAAVLAAPVGSRLLADEPKPPDVSKLPPAAAGPVDFGRDIEPLFAARCHKCHGPAKQSAGLRLDDGEAALKGGNSGKVIQPGDSAKSRLTHLVAGLEPDLKMPPKGEGLTTPEISKLRAWIDQGAAWPKRVAVATAAATNHWAFRPPRRVEPPAVKTPGWARNPIDSFILARLEAEGLNPSPEADRVTLIRRLHLDLLGLPPSPAEVDEFLADGRPDAYERLVDRVLSSPHYGERWGRHWLDAARYADSDGFEKDTGRPFAWRYRNWVIEALNRDLPYDQFVVEQLAGDLLPGSTVDQKVATGFHRNTLTNNEGGVDKEQFRVEQVVDRVNTTGTVFLGLTIGCCQCHDHKYDPFTQREYYQLFAFFNSTNEVNIDAPLPQEIEPYRQKKLAFDQKKGELQAVLDFYVKDQLPAQQRKWEDELKLTDLRKLPANITALLLSDPEKRTEQQKKELADFYAKGDKKLAELKKALADHDKTAPQLTQAQTLAEGSARKTHVLIRGDFLRPGAEVDPGTPAVLPPLKAEKKTRLELARWIASPQNPLTARVAVNWHWLHHFGRGLVNTPNDFGTQGERPSHPELLDWLATEFTRQGWSMKALHRLIVTSATYRQSSQVRPELRDRDPLNVLLARQSRMRLEAEVVRDNALAAGGLLNRTIGGPSVRPPQPPGISDLTYAGSARWVESTGPDRYRRGLYTWFQRTSPYPMLMTFDSPDSNVCCVRRERTNTPLQALTLLNDAVFTECAQALAKRVLEEPVPAGTAATAAGGAGPAPDDLRLRRAFRLCVAREPTPEELAALGRLLTDLLQAARAKPEEAAKLTGTHKPGNVPPADAAAWVALARTLLNLDEFVTRE